MFQNLKTKYTKNAVNKGRMTSLLILTLFNDVISNEEGTQCHRTWVNDHEW
jgi:hypothetical protein